MTILPTSKLLLVFALTLVTVAARATAADFAAPTSWPGSTVGAVDGNPAQANGASWRFDQVWPDDLGNAANFQPMVWGENGWKAGVAKSGHGGQPSAKVTEAGVQLGARGEWAGRKGKKIAALAFVAPEAGAYAVTGKATAKAGEGDGEVELVFLKRSPSAGTVTAIGDTRVKDAAVTLLTKPVELAAGDELVVAARVSRQNTSATVTLTDYRITSGEPGAAGGPGAAAGAPEAGTPVVAGATTMPAAPIEPGDTFVPADANAGDVRALYGARGDGATDDTAAIQRALDDRRNIVYLPAGTYVVSDTLRWGKGEKRQTFQGQGRGRTVLRLKDATPGFHDPAAPRAVIWTGKRPAQRFRNAVRDLTIDTGAGNPGAIGAQFIANNQGTFRDVTIRSSDPSGAGAIGLDLGYTDEQGPCLVKHVEVVGFDVGIRTKHAVDSVVFEHVTLRGQRRVGLSNDGQCLSIRGLTSENAVTALESTGPAVVTLIDSVLTGVGGASELPAVVNAGGLFARNVQTPGYARAIDNAAGTTLGVAGVDVSEFVSHAPLSFEKSADARSLNLPIAETPVATWVPPSEWVSVGQFMPPAQTGKKKDDPVDATEAVREAMDAGKPVVYFPKGTYHFTGSVTVPAHVKRVVGFESNFAKELKGDLVIGPGTDPLILERFDWMYSDVTVRHASTRTLVIQHTVGGNYEAGPEAGDLFLEDFCQGSHVFRKQQRVWARQFDNESRTEKVLNDGGTLWVLGYKGESDGTYVRTTAGGRTEVVGGFCYANSGRPKQPMFVVEEGAALSFTIGEWVIRNAPFGEVVVRTRGGQTETLRTADAPGRGGGSMVPLFVSWP